MPDVPEAIRNQIKRDKYISKSGTKSKGVRRSKPSIFERGSRSRAYVKSETERDIRGKTEEISLETYNERIKSIN